MKFEEIIEVAAKWIEDTDDIQGYEIDLYDSLYPLGNVVCKDNAGIERDYEEYKRSMINYQITLKDSFNSFQDVNRISLIIRFVTVSTWCYITGTIEIIGPHYEKLYQEYLDFIARSK
ncbi:MAG: hypothetical protein RJA11_536 [Bacteroidota bacterium]